MEAMEAMRQETRKTKVVVAVEGFARNRENDGDYIEEEKSVYVRIRVRCCMRKSCSHSPVYWKNEPSVVQRDQTSFVKSYIYLLKCIWFGRGFQTPWSHSHVLAAFFWFARSHHDRRTREQGTWVGKQHPQGPNLALMRIQQNSNSLDLHSALVFLPPGEFSVTPDFEMWRGDACANASAIASLDGSSSHCKCSVTRWQAGRAMLMLRVLFCGVSQEWVRFVWQADCKWHKLDNYAKRSRRHTILVSLDSWLDFMRFLDWYDRANYCFEILNQTKKERWCMKMQLCQ